MTISRATLTTAPSNVTVTGSGTLFSYVVPGGTLATHNSIIFEAQGTISFGGAATLTLTLVYGGTTLATCLVTSLGVLSGKSIFIDARLSADGSASSQSGYIRSLLGVAPSQDGSTPVGSGIAGESSGGDLTLSINGSWSGGGNTITIYYASLELLGFGVDTSIALPEEPTAYIFLNSKLNKLHYSLRKDAVFYCPCEHELTFFGDGSVTFTRAAASTATWNDGATHTVAANKPRFEYSGGSPLGLAINTGTEVLTFSTLNLLSDSSTLCWVQDGVFKSTPTNTNPFNGSGVYTGSSGVHVKQFVKFKRVLTINEIAAVQAILV
jgi:hypothetical protein